MHLIHHQQSTQSIADYLAQLLKDRKQLAAFPNVFNHVERLLDEGNYCNLFSPLCVSLERRRVIRRANRVVICMKSISHLDRPE